MNGTILAGAFASGYVALICFRDGLEGVEDKRWGKVAFEGIFLICWIRITYNLAFMAFGK